MQKIIYIGIGGCLGSILRYLVTVYTPKITGTAFPYGTLLVNVAGGILIGFIMNLCVQVPVSPLLKTMLTTGFIGGLTTFSTFSYETVLLFTAGRYGAAGLNVLLNLGLSFSGVFLGQAASRCFF